MSWKDLIYESAKASRLEVLVCWASIAPAQSDVVSRHTEGLVFISDIKLTIQ